MKDGQDLSPTKVADAVDHATLNPLVRRVLGHDTAAVTDWQWSQLPYQSFLPGRTLVRFSGRAGVDGVNAPWSLILKIVRPPAHDGGETSLDDAWKREALAYSSGLLEEIPGGPVAPRAFQITESNHRAIWMWLEDITDVHDRHWPLESYGVAARDLGQFNGAYLVSRAVPTYPWLMAQWCESHSEPRRVREAVAEVEALVMDPRVRREFAIPIADPVRRLLADQGGLLNILAQLPQTLCHHDAAQANLFARRRTDGHTETVAIDWETIGPGTVGAEIATLVFSTLRRRDFSTTNASGLDQVTFDGYVEGLRAAGWTGEPFLIRLGYAAAIALRWSLLVNTLRTITDDGLQVRLARDWQQPVGQIIEQRVALSTFLLDRAAEARELAQQYLTIR